MPSALMNKTTLDGSGTGAPAGPRNSISGLQNQLFGSLQAGVPELG